MAKISFSQFMSPLSTAQKNGTNKKELSRDPMYNILSTSSFNKKILTVCDTVRKFLEMTLHIDLGNKIE